MIVVNPTGGGLSNGKLAQATATPADVLSGKKFYAGDDTLKTGTLVPNFKTATGEFEGGATPLSINCGFSPSIILFYNSAISSSSGFDGWFYQSFYYVYSTSGIVQYNNSGIAITASGFYIAEYADFPNRRMTYIAIGI